MVRAICVVQIRDGKSKGLDADIGLEKSNKSAGYRKQYALVWKHIEEGR